MTTFFVQDADLHRVSLEPANQFPVALAIPAPARGVAHAWRLHGGLLTALSERVGIDAGCAVAVLCVESGGAGFGADGRMVIRFENHVFRREWGGRTFDRYFRHDAQRRWEGHQFRTGPTAPWASFHGRQAMEWQVFELARQRNETAAMRSISMGAPQIMGFNHARLGYETVQAMFERFSADVRFQIIGLFDFLAAGAADSPLLDALRTRDFGRFASGYNGPGQAAIYGELINRHVELFEQLERAARAVRPGDAAPTPRSRARSGAVSAVRPERSCMVKAGDTLGAIAGRYGVPLAALVAANGIANPDRIAVGQMLRIPGADTPPPPPAPAAHQPPTDLEEEAPAATQRTYTVARGDTLGAIARRLHIAMTVLVELNGIADANRIRAGQVLRLPD